MLNLRPVKLLPVREQAAASLREAIITRSIKAGEVLPLETTAKALGISVTPLREAFQILARDGLIELAQNRGAVVIGMNEKTIREHFEIRAALESEACRLTCEKKSDISAIEQCMIQTQKINYSDYNQSFHYNIWLASGNSRLVSMLSELWNGLSMGLQTSRSEYANKSLSEHEKIFAAVKAYDTMTAAALMHAHIIRSMNDILTRYE